MTDTPEPVAQEPKYTFISGLVFNRASGEPIPLDEPVMVFRARDIHAVAMIKFYAGLVNDPHHKDIVMQRAHDFEMFRLAHPERMKEPDTDATTATRPADDIVRQLVESLRESTEHMEAVFANKDLLTDNTRFMDAFCATMHINRAIIAGAAGYGGDHG